MEPGERRRHAQITGGPWLAEQDGSRFARVDQAWSWTEQRPFAEPRERDDHCARPAEVAAGSINLEQSRARGDSIASNLKPDSRGSRSTESSVKGNPGVAPALVKFLPSCCSGTIWERRNLCKTNPVTCLKSVTYIRKLNRFIWPITTSNCRLTLGSECLKNIRRLAHNARDFSLSWHDLTSGVEREFTSCDIRP